MKNLQFYRGLPRACSQSVPVLAAAQFKTGGKISAVVGLLLAVFSASAQSYSVDWFKIAGGGGTSTGAVYSVSGTIGQHDAGGPMTGGAYSLTGGFWALSAVQTPGAPSLRIQLTSTNTALISWPSPSTAFTLQVNTDLETSNWSPATETVNDNGTTKYIIVNPPVGRKFYRLIH
jgi:hypothetical protein